MSGYVNPYEFIKNMLVSPVVSMDLGIKAALEREKANAVNTMNKAHTDYYNTQAAKEAAEAKKAEAVASMLMGGDGRYAGQGAKWEDIINNPAIALDPNLALGVKRAQEIKKAQDLQKAAKRVMGAASLTEEGINTPIEKMTTGQLFGETGKPDILERGIARPKAVATAAMGVDPEKATQILSNILKSEESQEALNDYRKDTLKFKREKEANRGTGGERRGKPNIKKIVDPYDGKTYTVDINDPKWRSWVNERNASNYPVAVYNIGQEKTGKVSRGTSGGGSLADAIAARRAERSGKPASSGGGYAYRDGILYDSQGNIVK